MVMKKKIDIDFRVIVIDNPQQTHEGESIEI